MELTAAIDRFAANAAAIQSLVAGVDANQASWHPSPDAWSILEVINHLADEEREDFRTRVDLTLHQPDADWPKIEPGAWVTQRDYAGRGLAESLTRFLDERATSLTWLRGLQAPNWESEHRHPQFGGMTAGQLFAAWLAHDLLHLRQLVELHYLYHREHAAPDTVDYAGDW